MGLGSIPPELTPVGTDLVNAPCLPWCLEEGGECQTDYTGETSFNIS